MLISSFCNVITYANYLPRNANSIYVNQISNYGGEAYNCYAYAIGRVENSKFYDINEGLKYQPGDIYTTWINYPSRENLDQIRCSVISDLIAIGYGNFSVFYADSAVDEIPTIDEGQELICFRIGAVYGMNGNNEEYLERLDYHFMKYDLETESWYHKPGTLPIMKFEGVPNPEEVWSGEIIGENLDLYPIENNQRIEYSGTIVYLSYSKLKIDVLQDGNADKDILIKGDSNYRCCTEGNCCCGRENCGCGNEENESDGLCCCGLLNCGDVINSPFLGKDVIYEIDIPYSGLFSIQMSTEYNEHNFNYEIYSYNMYNGNYINHKIGSGNSGSAVTEVVNLTLSTNTTDLDQAYKHYIRLDFGKLNTTNESINISITHEHSYTDHYESVSNTKHNAYCWCGEYKSVLHDIDDEVCTDCGATHEHEYAGWQFINNKYHEKTCFCGEVSSQKGMHVVKSGTERYKTCMLCGGTVDTWNDFNQIQSNQNLVTENGSYIMPNGVIVLVEEDVEAYFSGELEFYDRNANLDKS